MSQDDLSSEEIEQIDREAMSGAIRDLRVALENTRMLADRLERTIKIAEEADDSDWGEIGHAVHIANFTTVVLDLDFHMNAMLIGEPRFPPAEDPAHDAEPSGWSEGLRK